MKIVEFRIPIPLKLTDYQRCSIHLLIEASLKEMEGGCGLEVFRNEMFKCNDRVGYYTEKRYHLAKNLPGWLQSILGTKLTILTEKSWNLYPKLFTKYFNEVFPSAEFSLQTENIESLTVSENALNLSLQDLNKRNVIFVDLTKFNKLKNYDSKIDLTKFKAGNFLPLKNDWFKQSESVGMISYKLLKLNLPQFGLLSSKIESYIVNFFYESLMYYTCMGLCSYEKWNDLTIENLRVTENECYDKLNEAFRNHYSKSLDKSLKLSSLKVDKGAEIHIPREISHTVSVPEKKKETISSSKPHSKEQSVSSTPVSVSKASVTPTSRVTTPSSSAVTVAQPLQVSQSTTPQATSFGSGTPSKPTSVSHLAPGTQPSVVPAQQPTGVPAPGGDAAAQQPVGPEVKVMVNGDVSVDKHVGVVGKPVSLDLGDGVEKEKESVRSEVSCATYTSEAVSPQFADDRVLLFPNQELAEDDLEMTGPVPVMSYDDSEFMDAVENLEDLEDHEKKKGMGLLDRFSSVLRFVRSPSSHEATRSSRAPSVDEAIQVDLIHEPEPTSLDKEFYGLDRRVLSDGTPFKGSKGEGDAEFSGGLEVDGQAGLDKSDKTKRDELRSKGEQEKEMDNIVSLELSDKPTPKSTTGKIISTVVKSQTGSEKETSKSEEVSDKVTEVKESSQKPADKGKKDPISYDIPITFTGYLYKLGRGFSCWTWNLRYIIVCGFNLYYFDRKNDMRPKDTINLKNSRISWAGTHMNRPYVFSITTEDKMVYYWSADEEDSVKRWILLLQVLCEESPPYIVKQLAYELTYHQNNSENLTNNINKF